MRSWDLKRGSVLVLLAALVVTACSGGRASSSAAGPVGGPRRSVGDPQRGRGAGHADLPGRRHGGHQARAQALADAYTAQHPNVTIEIETRPGGTEGDNIVKTRLATGEMTDIFWYNSGSLFQALNPTETLVDLSGEPFIANIAESFLPTVSQGDGIYGVPCETAMGGGILYNKKIYADLGLSVPTTWAEFAANNETSRPPASPRRRDIRATPGPPSCSCSPTTTTCRRPSRTSPSSTPTTRSSTPTRRPRWRASSTSRKPSRRAGTRRTSARRRFDDGLKLLAEGEIAHYPMLTFALVDHRREPSRTRSRTSGSSPSPATTPPRTAPRSGCPRRRTSPRRPSNLEEAKEFLAFIASVEGRRGPDRGRRAVGSVRHQGRDAARRRAARRSRTSRPTSTATRPLPRSSSCRPSRARRSSSITVAVGSGLRSAEDGAALYDQDVEKQAKQLGLPGW